MFCLILLCLNGYMYILFTYVCLYIFKFTFMSLRFVVFFVQTFFRDIEDSDSITFGFFFYQYQCSAVPYSRSSFTCRFLCFQSIHVY